MANSAIGGFRYSVPDGVYGIDGWLAALNPYVVSTQGAAGGPSRRKWCDNNDLR